MRGRSLRERIAGSRRSAGAVLLAMLAPLTSTAAPVATVAEPAISSPSDQTDQQLPTVIVTPDDDVLSASDRKLAKLLKSLPGADDAVAAKKGLGEKIGDYYDAHRDPNDLSSDARQRLSREVNGDPERQNLH